MSFGDLELDQRLSKEHFLRRSTRRSTGAPLEEPLKALYHPRLGRPSHCSSFKALLLQRWYDLSDPASRRPSGIASLLRFWDCLLDDPVPDWNGNLPFSPWKNRVGGTPLYPPGRAVGGPGRSIRQGTLIDATLVKSHSRPTTPLLGASPDSHVAASGEEVCFGYRPTWP